MFVASSQIGIVLVHRCVLPAAHSTQIPSGSLHTGSALPQFASLEQPWLHVCVVVLHRPFDPVQSAPVLHWTQTFATGSQAGFELGQALVFTAEHSAHLPALGPAFRHAGSVTVGQLALVFEPWSPLQATQTPAALQNGLLPEHWALLEHSAQVFVVVLHAGLVPVHAVVFAFEHWTHFPASGPVRAQAGFAAVVQGLAEPEPKSPSQGTHRPSKQLGVEPPHSALVLHSTHRFFVVLQIGVGAAHCDASRHWTHWFVAVLHFANGKEQFASVVQPGPHVFVPRLQTPLAPVHWPLERHWTHSCVASLQKGSPGVQAAVLVPPGPALHSTQEPAAHAGALASGHASVAGGVPAVPRSALQAAHVPVAVLQMGLGPVATQFPLVVHSTHWFEAVLQTGFVPVQSFVFPALHWTQMPVAMLHAGAALVGQACVAAVPLSPSHFTQTPRASQTGLSGAVQFELERQPTQTFRAVSQNGVAPPH